MTDLQIFNSPEFGAIRTIEKDGEPWFVGKDVAAALGYERPTKAILDHVDDEDKDEVPIQDSIGRSQNTPIISESGLYSLCCRVSCQRQRSLSAGLQARSSLLSANTVPI